MQISVTATAIIDNGDNNDILAFGNNDSVVAISDNYWRNVIVVLIIENGGEK